MQIHRKWQDLTPVTPKLLNRSSPKFAQMIAWDIRTLKLLNQLPQNLAQVIMSATRPRMPKFKPIAPMGTSRQMGEILLSRGMQLFSFFCDPNFCWHSETKSQKRFSRGLIHKHESKVIAFPEG